MRLLIMSQTLFRSQLAPLLGHPPLLFLLFLQMAKSPVSKRNFFERTFWKEKPLFLDCFFDSRKISISLLFLIKKKRSESFGLFSKNLFRSVFVGLPQQTPFMKTEKNAQEKKVSGKSARPNQPGGLPSMIAGAVAGAGTNLLFYPLDLIKSRYQVTPRVRGGGNIVQPPTLTGLPVYRNLFHAFAAISRTEGVLAFYQGVVPSLVGNSIAWGAYFYVYNQTKKIALENLKMKSINGGGSEEEARLPPPVHLLCGFLAGMVTLGLTNPIWVVKLRMQVHQKNVDAGARRYRGLMHGMGSLLREEGMRGWFRGIVPGIWMTSHGAIQFMAYEELIYEMNRFEKKRIRSDDSAEKNSSLLNSGHYLIAGGVSKSIAIFVTSPVQVIRARFQLKPEEGKGYYSGFTDSVKKVWMEEGIRGFYRGVWVNICRVGPTGAVTFFLYENLMRIIEGRGR